MAAPMTSVPRADPRKFVTCRRARFMLAVLACTLTVGAVPACGGGQKARSTTGASATASTTRVNVAADEAKARTLLLRSSDFPAGWKSRTGRSTPKEPREEVASCLARPVPDTYTTAGIDSPRFSLGNADTGSRAQLVRTVEDFRADMAAYSGPKFIPCLKSTLVDSFRRGLRPHGGSLESLSVEPLQVPRYGQISVGSRLTAKVRAQGQRLTIYTDYILLGKERIELWATFFNVDQPFSRPWRAGLWPSWAAG